MAGTAPNWRVAAVAQNPGQLWADLAIPGAGARLTLDADGTPDATANPNAMHLGATREGAKLMIKSSFTNYEADEFTSPIITNLEKVDMGIAAELLGVTDMELVEFLLPGVGTSASAAGYEQIKVGRKAITYSSLALIFPRNDDPTRFAVFHIYRGLNDAGIEWAQGRKVMGGIPVNFVGYEITTRAQNDTVGSYWKQVA